ncbi:uncharacterized protein LOC112559267 [Pomacea canaliculata]|uniref:uncharacterized protein LOC112559267 n=1 Tax=Pomacea canaliculata TaxID=400727 RepID=UPI000D726754|nr:uncharacterized protein LOC112559267 [Pomacea canaliculata]
MTTICVPVITALCVFVALMTVFILVFILLVKIIKDKTCDMLKKTERDEDDFVDIRPRDADRAANADCGVYVISDVSQSGESHLHETAQVQVKGQGPVLGEKLPVPSSDETNECTPDKNTSEDTQYDTLVQQRPDEREEYMRLHVMSAAARPQVEGQVTHHFVLP